MLLWLSGVKNTVRAPNENYGREMMELFTLGVDNGYTENDVREQARALTGWRGRRKDDNPADFTYEPRLHDSGTKTIFGKSGAFDWQDSCRLCLEHPNHPAYFVGKLWSYFVPTAPAKATKTALQSIYRDGYRILPVVEAILQHPDLYDGPRMVKPPVVYTAGPAARARPRRRLDPLDAARRGLRAAALLPAQRRRLGRHALARHRDLPRPLVPRRPRLRGEEAAGRLRRSRSASSTARTRLSAARP